MKHCWNIAPWVWYLPFLPFPFLPFYFLSSHSKTGGQIFTIYTTNDAYIHPRMYFLRVSMIKDYSGYQSKPHKTYKKRAWLGNFKPNVRKIEFSVSSKQQVRSIQNLTGHLRPPTRHRGLSYKSVNKIVIIIISLLILLLQKWYMFDLLTTNNQDSCLNFSARFLTLSLQTRIFVQKRRNSKRTKNR